MKLFSLEVAGFRGFATRQLFDLSADAVIVVGANGNGKTSLFDAILWAIAGRIPRLHSDDSLLACKFSETGQARVVLRIGLADGSAPLTITRIFDGKQTKVAVETRDEVLRGPEAEGRLIQAIWREAASAASPAESVATALTRSVYLQQDLVRDFIDSVSANDRFSAVSELVGAGRVTDLQGELERAKKAWTSATNNRAAELLPLRNRLATMEARLAELKARTSPPDAGLDETAWADWWKRMQAIGLNVSEPPIASREAATSIESAVRQIDAARRVAERKKQLLYRLDEDVRSITKSPKPDLIRLRQELQSAQEAIKDTRSKVSVEQTRVAEFHRLQAELKEKSEQLRALATLALQHLGDTCPVCDQKYDSETTRRRLQAIASTTNRFLGALRASNGKAFDREDAIPSTKIEVRTINRTARLADS